MSIQRIRIVSNNICYDPCPAAEDEVEQHLTITADGRVFFSVYIYGPGFGAHKRERMKNFIINKTDAVRVLDLIDKYYSGDPEICEATDIGTWDMRITYSDGTKADYKGSLCFHMTVDGIDIGRMIRSVLGIDELYLFDGVYDEESEAPANDCFLSGEGQSMCRCPLCDEIIYSGTCMEVSDHFDRQPSTTDLPAWVDASKEIEQKTTCQACKFHCF